MTTVAALAAIVGGSAFLSACQKNIEGTLAAYADDQPAGVLYNRGLGYMNAGKFGDAIDEFDEVDRQHPYSEEARKALVMSAFASYRRGDYDNAISTGAPLPDALSRQPRRRLRAIHSSASATSPRCAT